MSYLLATLIDSFHSKDDFSTNDSYEKTIFKGYEPKYYQQYFQQSSFRNLPRDQAFHIHLTPH